MNEELLVIREVGKLFYELQIKNCPVCNIVFDSLNCVPSFWICDATRDRKFLETAHELRCLNCGHVMKRQPP